MSGEAVGRIVIARAIFEGIEAVRHSGLTNMLDRAAVIEIAESMGYEESAKWVRENREAYARAIFQGFEIVEDPGDARADPPRTEHASE